MYHFVTSFTYAPFQAAVPPQAPPSPSKVPLPTANTDATFIDNKLAAKPMTVEGTLPAEKGLENAATPGSDAPLSKAVSNESCDSTRETRGGVTGAGEIAMASETCAAAE